MVIETLAVTGSLAAVVASLFASLFSEKSFKTDKQAQPNYEVSDELAVTTRLNELRVEHDRSRNLLRLTSVSANLLTFSQFVVGGVLASGFLQEAVLSREIVGALGLIVLLASIIQQRFRPDLHAALARKRMYAARRCIRDVEDGIYKINSKDESAPAVISIRRKAKSALNALDQIDQDGKEEIAEEVKKED